MPARIAHLYRRLAQESVEMASGASHPHTRATLEHFAKIWLRLAADELSGVGRKAKRPEPAPND
jgi:hypothetical protein